MELQTRMRDDLLPCVATVTICLVTKATHLFGPSISSSQSCFPVRTHPNHRSKANLRASYKTECLDPPKICSQTFGT